MIEKFPLKVRRILAWWILIVSIIAGLGYLTIIPAVYIMSTGMVSIIKFWTCIVSGLMGVFSVWSGWYTFQKLVK